MDKTPTRSNSTRIRERFFAESPVKVQGLNSPIPIQLSDGSQSRTGMADAIDPGVCDLVGLGRAGVLEPELPRKLLLNPDYDDSLALGMSHQFRKLWFGKMFPIKIIGGSFGIQFFLPRYAKARARLVQQPTRKCALDCWRESLGYSGQRFHTEGAEIFVNTRA